MFAAVFITPVESLMVLYACLASCDVLNTEPPAQMTHTGLREELQTATTARDV